jgi:hypothetical protein
MAKKAQPLGAQRSKTDGESIQGYFRRIFQEKPRLLRERSNAELLRRWLADHPGEIEVPKQVKSGLANLKSVLRSKSRKRKARAEGGPLATAAKRPAPPRTKLEKLEELIDDALIFARTVDREGLEDVILHLRKARTAVVWKMGE